MVMWEYDFKKSFFNLNNNDENIHDKTHGILNL